MTTLRIVLGIVLIAAGIGKLRSREAFAKTLMAFGVTSPAWAVFFGCWLSYTEVAVGLLLSFSVWSPVAGYAAAGLFLMFGSAIAVRLLAGPVDVSCGCFGRFFSAKITWQLMWRNLVFAFIAVLVR